MNTPLLTLIAGDLARPLPSGSSLPPPHRRRCRQRMGASAASGAAHGFATTLGGARILKVAERPDVLSFAGGLPAPSCFRSRPSPKHTTRCWRATDAPRCSTAPPRASGRCASGSPRVCVSVACESAPSRSSSPTARSRASIWWRACCLTPAMRWPLKIPAIWRRCSRSRAARRAF